MRLTPWILFLALFLAASFLRAECVNDQRSNKNAGILIIDFTITGTKTIGTTELADITSDLIGSCFDDNTEELEERVRTSFQNRGYFVAKVKSLGLKPRDQLGIPKPVTLEAEVSDGLQYKLADITFLENRAFSSEQLRKQFPLGRGDLLSREKVAGGLMSLFKLYSTQGFLDLTVIPNTNFASDGTANLDITVLEGPQYHMGKLDIVANEQLSARLRTEWTLAEGAAYDQTYIDQYLDANRVLLPQGFRRTDVRIIQNCPDAAVQVRLVIDPAEDPSHTEPKNVPCKEHYDFPE